MNKAFKWTLLLLASSVLLVAHNRAPKSTELTVATYNIRFYTEADIREGNGWERRAPVLCNLIEFHDFDIFGAQEVTERQLSDMLEYLQGYDNVGSEGSGGGIIQEQVSPIFYKKDRFEVLQSGFFWLSETPEESGKGWDAAYPRVCAWAQFSEKSSGNVFWFFNTHLDHKGVEARLKGSALIVSKIKELTDDNHHVILTGDFNADQQSDPYKLIIDSGILQDGYELAKISYIHNGTFNNFDIDKKSDSRIDHIFLSNNIEVTRYGVLTDYYLAPDAESDGSIESKKLVDSTGIHKFIVRLPSDHYPVVVKIRL